GIDLSPSGLWSVRDAQLSIEEHGIGVKKGDAAKITAIKLHDEYIEFHLDGGGAGVFAQGFGPDRSKELDKVEGGSRINLRFDRQITHGDVQDLGRIVSFLEPVVDCAQIQHSANMATALAPVEAPAPVPAVAQASAFGAPLLDPAPQAVKPAPAPMAAKSKVAPIETKAAAAPPVPIPAPVAPAPVAPAPVAAPAASPVVTPKTVTAKDVAATKIEAGMDRMAVYQLLGQPGYKRVDVSKEVPVEKWQYDLPANGKRIITFENGKVLRVEDF
ncbi:MAG TPA: hypothetical protein VNM87_08135, partial [Candidatus Udaeobacter sp.]|nr:hypothetical protein [Candidatus Udaeobacter sp.]